ncbi:MAG: hypothetical protein CVT89_00720 [Candidatus Altiarchaeales archaeon HGW-Altiarchaeales-2]|nr:MAG: hypothetical protein CVT89_00720 [Candidatus Altiarchaeales archaeon HGW-Altiarchaeales-2]
MITAPTITGIRISFNGELELEKLKREFNAEQISEKIIKFKLTDEYEAYIKFLNGVDYSIYQVWVTSIEDDFKTQDFEKLENLLEKIEEKFEKFNSLIYSCFSFDNEKEVIKEAETYSLIRNNSFLLTRKEKKESTLYSLIPKIKEIERTKETQGMIVDEISLIETYYTKIIRFYNIYEKNYAPVVKKEDEIQKLLGEETIETDKKKLEKTLKDRESSYSKIFEMSSALRRDSQSVMANIYNIKSIFVLWNESYHESYPLSSKVMYSRVENVYQCYTLLSEKLSEIAGLLNNNVSVIRAKIELKQEGNTKNIQTGIILLTLITATHHITNLMLLLIKSWNPKQEINLNLMMSIILIALLLSTGLLFLIGRILRTKFKLQV